MAVVDVAGQTLFYVDDGAGPPLVWLHGFPLDHSMWQGAHREFRSTHRVLIPDLRGFGRSASSDDLITMDRLADDVVAMLDHAGVTGSVTLGGLSMGGYVAFALWRRHPDRIARLILSNTRAIADTDEIRARREKLAALVVKDGARIVAETMLPTLFGPDTNEHRPAVVDAVRNMILANPPRGIAAVSRGLAARLDSTPTLPTITVPTLVVIGNHDVISPPGEMREFAAKLPHATVVELPRAGHLAPMESPTEFHQAIREWLAG